MRIALTLFVTVAALLGAGCSSGGYNSCRPKTECCPQWQPNCCNSWDWYVPCDTIEGRQLRQGRNCDQLPACACK